MEKALHHYGYERFTRDGYKIYHENRFVAEIIPHKTIPQHYHIQFSWREAPTPEFFNIVNAIDNAKRIALHRLNYDMGITPVGASQERLNEGRATHAA